jgi:hypothetical protein
LTNTVALEAHGGNSTAMYAVLFNFNTTSSCVLAGFVLSGESLDVVGASTRF